ncbi:hypothetical protein ABLE68_13600 [Nocardioides sp. CN2-186]|uniref:hypothetical protein n=1 Tax=Nocardioides tweenelious TaxID=3156607 RepID=UPI0032B53F3D
MIYVLMLVGGLALAAWNTWQHLGRSPAARSWARSVKGSWGVRSVLVVRPLIAVVLVLGAVTGWMSADSGAYVVLGLAIGVSLVALLAFLVLPLPVPRFAQPSWFQRTTGARAATRG